MMKKMAKYNGFVYRKHYGASSAVKTFFLSRMAEMTLKYDVYNNENYIIREAKIFDCS